MDRINEQSAVTPSSRSGSGLAPTCNQRHTCTLSFTVSPASSLHPPLRVLHLRSSVPFLKIPRPLSVSLRRSPRSHRAPFTSVYRCKKLLFIDESREAAVRQDVNTCTHEERCGYVALSDARQGKWNPRERRVVVRKTVGRAGSPPRNCAAGPSAPNGHEV